MRKHRRLARLLALACFTAAVSTAPSTALARPAGTPPGHPGSNGSRGATAAEPQTVVRTIQAGGDQTLALILSGSALIVAIAGAGYSGRSRHRVHRVAQPLA